MGQRQSGGVSHRQFKRGLSTGTLSRDLQTLETSKPANNSWRYSAGGTSLLPPGAVQDDEGPTASARVRMVLEKQTSLESMCSNESHHSLNNESAYSATRLLHEPRLRLNSRSDSSSCGSGSDRHVLTLRERRNSILTDNLLNLNLLLSMDDEDLVELGLTTRIHKRISRSFRPVTKHGRKRRNSSNSIFLTQTAENILDQKALVQSISAGFYSAIQDAPGKVTRQYSIFVDPDHKYFCRPTYKEVLRFVNNIYQRAQLEAEVLIISLIYFERLLVATKAQVVVGYRNWRSISLACCVLASKVWDDLSMINADFSTIMANKFTLKQINQLEVAMLSALKFDVKVSLSTYALYYFKLRALLGPGALFKASSNPLSIRDAQKMQALSSSYSKKLTILEGTRRRTSTIGSGEEKLAKKLSTASLEHIILRNTEKQKAREMYEYRLSLRSQKRREQRDREDSAARKTLSSSSKDQVAAIPDAQHLMERRRLSDPAAPQGGGERKSNDGDVDSKGDRSGEDTKSDDSHNSDRCTRRAAEQALPVKSRGRVNIVPLQTEDAMESPETLAAVPRRRRSRRAERHRRAAETDSDEEEDGGADSDTAVDGSLYDNSVLKQAMAMVGEDELDEGSVFYDDVMEFVRE